jgi:flagellar hook-length control protein FliK
LEILSNLQTGTGSGAELGQRSRSSRASPQTGQSEHFARVVDNARQTRTKQAQAGQSQASKAFEDDTLSDKDLNDRFLNPRYMLSIMHLMLNDEPDETLAIGVIDTQMVVSVLEGDKESATTPLMDNTAVESTDTTYKTDGLEVKSEESIIKTTEEPIIKTTEEPITKTSDEQTESYAQVQKAATEIPKQVQNGEVTARTPSTEDSEKKSTSEINSKSSDFGDLSPLENENDTAPVKEQPKQSFNDMTNSKSRENEAETPVNNIHAPLSDEGIRPERLQAEEQLKSAALDPPVKAENLFEEMVQRVEMMKTDSTRTMTIQLRPDYLGEVALELVSDAAGMHVKIEAANSDVRSMINAQVTALIESLEQKGIEVAEVEVTYTGIDIGAHNTGPKGDNAQTSNNSGNNNGYRRDMRPERMDYYAGLKIDVAEYYLDIGVSSVEFSA